MLKQIHLDNNTFETVTDGSGNGSENFSGLGDGTINGRSSSRFSGIGFYCIDENIAQGDGVYYEETFFGEVSIYVGHG